ncbi:hypothetical protein MYX76_18965, partial [Desulfobacterota bacterium AH_259_B03_O07]|nr:hypothetical protein [Desulfobacterota bacterium AH_259_B03_O07]
LRQNLQETQTCMSGEEDEVKKIKLNNKEREQLASSFLLEDKKEESNHYMSIWREMNSNERFKLDLEAKMLIKFGNNEIGFSGRDSPELNRYRIQTRN